MNYIIAEKEEQEYLHLHLISFNVTCTHKLATSSELDESTCTSLNATQILLLWLPPNGAISCSFVHCARMHNVKSTHLPPNLIVILISTAVPALFGIKCSAGTANFGCKKKYNHPLHE